MVDGERFYKVGFSVLRMRLMLLLLLGLFLVGFVGAVIPDDCDISEDMIAYWRMNNNLEDSFGGYDNGVWIGTARYTPAVGFGAMFMGSESISISGVNALDFQFAFTVEFLISSDSSFDAVLFEKGSYEISWVDGGVGANSVAVDIGGVTLSAGSLSSNTNYHIVLTWEPTDDLILYVDGVERDRTFLSKADPGVVGSLIIGSGFSGWIDEVAAYDSALSQSSVNYHYALLNVDKDYCDPSGVGGSSSSKSDFNIAGCVLPDESGLTRGSCSINGEYYCDDDEVLYLTRADEMGCSLGQGSYTPGDDYCCPSGLYCNATGPLPICSLRTEQCSEQLDESACENIGCIWLEGENLCVDSTHDYSCSIYETETTCDEDIWNLAKEGVGTEVCGSYMVVDNIGYVVPYDTCACEWDFGDLSCKLGYDIFPDIYGASVDWFKCLKDFVMGECIEGEQDFNWSVSQIEATGVYDFTDPSYNATLFNNVAVASGCSSGQSVRNCGEPVIRLPGFSLFALIGAVLVIGLVYFVRKY